MFGLGILKTLFGWLWSGVAGLVNAREATTAAIGSAAMHTAGVEAKARAEVQIEQTRAGWFWMTFPFLMIAGASATYYVLIVADTVFGFSWNVEKLPPPFDSTINQIILVTGGVSGGIGALGMILGRR